MISTFFGLEIGKRGILTHRAGLEVTSHNIVNAETPGYSRQRAELVTTPPHTVPQTNRAVYPGQAGSGVNAAEVIRIRCLFLDRQVHNQLSVHDQWSSRSGYLTQIQHLLNEPSEDAIRGQINLFWKALEDLANDPGAAATRQVVVESGQTLSSAIGHLYQDLKDLREIINTELQFKVDDINHITGQIADLNGKIRSIQNIGDNPNDLMDRRDLLVEDLARLINIDVDMRYPGSELVISSGSHALVQGMSNKELTLERNYLNDNMFDINAGFNQRPVSSNESVFMAYANSSAPAGKASIEVQQLAKTHMLEAVSSVSNAEQPLAASGNNPDITSGYVHINGQRMYVDPDRDSLMDIIAGINALDAGVMASRSSDGLNRLILRADDSGEDYRINLEAGYMGLEEHSSDEDVWLAEMASNLFHELGLTTSYWGEEGIIDTGADLYDTVNSRGDFFLPAAGGAFTINGHTISIPPQDPVEGNTMSLKELRDEINDRDKYPDLGVHALIVRNDAGRHQLVLEGEGGTYNYTIQDNDGILGNFGIFAPAAEEINAGNIVSATRFMQDIPGYFSNGILERGPASTIEITDGSSNSFTITVDGTNDSLSKIAESINNAAFMNDASVEARIIRTPDNEYRLAIVSTDQQPLTIASQSGHLLDKLGIDEGTYTGRGPLHLDGQDARYMFGGTMQTSSSNRIMDLMPGTTIEFKGTGLAQLRTEPVFTGGAVKGLLEIRDEVLVELMADLDELAYTLGRSMNEIHYEGFGLDGRGQRNFFEIYRSKTTGDAHKGAALAMGVAGTILEDINRVAAARADSNMTYGRDLPVSAGIGDGGNALDMAKLKQGRVMDDGQTTFDEFFSVIISRTGAHGQEAERMSDNLDLLLNNLEKERQSVMGVSLDEEMTNLIRYQHAFQASARVISTVDSMLDTIINRMRG